VKFNHLDGDKGLGGIWKGKSGTWLLYLCGPQRHRRNGVMVGNSGAKVTQFPVPAIG